MVQASLLLRVARIQSDAMVRHATFRGGMCQKVTASVLFLPIRLVCCDFVGNMGLCVCRSEAGICSRLGINKIENQVVVMAYAARERGLVRISLTTKGKTVPGVLTGQFCSVATFDR